ncbi:lipoyl(octanoyl) transferase LipB [Planctomycetota bacterium]
MCPRKSKNSELVICDCGIADYRVILDKQFELRDKRRAGEIGDTVLIVEHNPVITLGAREIANKLLVDRDELLQKGVDVVDIRRGGGSTAHNPGQLVFYPILNLNELSLGINEYVRKLEAIGMELLGQLGLSSERKKGFPGLWIRARKIAAIGVRVSKAITYHGMAINIQNDLSIFDHIVPCGLQNVEVTSVLKETGEKVPMSRAKKILTEILKKELAKE